MFFLLSNTTSSIIETRKGTFGGQGAGVAASARAA
jgi:hypothetical protein